MIGTDKLKIAQAIVVEGKYDKIKLSSFVDAVIICTGGFAVYKDKQTADLIRYYAENCGIIILTDSDSAGFLIRGYVKGICPRGKVTNVYIPEIFGKEKRKSAPSKEGKLGVEGMEIDVLRSAFEKAGVLGGEPKEHGEPVTRLDFYECGLSGAPDSTAKRRMLCKALGLPERLNANALLEAVNCSVSRSEFWELMQTINTKGESQ